MRTFVIHHKVGSSHTCEAETYGKMLAAVTEEFGGENIENIIEISITSDSYLKWVEEADTQSFAKEILEALFCDGFHTNNDKTMGGADFLQIVGNLAVNECLAPDDFRNDSESNERMGG
jgi:hypothetical protein